MNEPNIALESQPFLVISDVHSSLDNLEKILKRVPFGVRYKCFLGDAIGYGERSNEVISLLSRFDIGIYGNHDTFALGKNPSKGFSTGAIRSMKSNLDHMSVDSIIGLEKYVLRFSRKNILMFHGHPDTENEYIMSEPDVVKIFQEFPEYDLFFSGHLHIPRIAEYDKASGKTEFLQITRPLTRCSLDLKNKKYLITCPSVSYPRLSSGKGGCIVYPGSDSKMIFNMFFLD